MPNSTNKKSKTNKNLSSETSDLPVVNISVDDEECFPVPDSNRGFELKVSGLSEEMAIPPRMAFTIDCGTTLELPPGLHIQVETDAEWAKKGLVLTNVPLYQGQCRLKVMATNVGKQILAFQHGDTIGRFWFILATQVALIPSQ